MFKLDMTKLKWRMHVRNVAAAATVSIEIHNKC